MAGRVSGFKGIEGARAWLAWTVVGYHVFTWNAVSERLHWMHRLDQVGAWAVDVFIIISGFVIAHLLMAKKEPYGLYIARRALRIYPAYLVALLLGTLTFPLFLAAFDGVHLPSGLQAYVDADKTEYANRLGVHVATHLALLHGLFPNNILPQSQYMLLAPAWSLSLEWQFYLLAPLILLAGRRAPALLAAAVFGGLYAYNHGWLGQFNNPSTLPGALWLFLVGIGTRVVAGRVPRVESYPWTPVIACAGLVLFSSALIPVAIWAALVGYFQHEGRWEALDGRAARYFGERSYSVYLLHLPILFSALWLCSRLGLAFWPRLIVSGVLTTASTAVASDLMFRLVERPAMNLGKRLGSAKHVEAPGLLAAFPADGDARQALAGAIDVSAEEALQRP